MLSDKPSITDIFLEVREGVFTIDIEALSNTSADKKSLKKSPKDCCHSYRKGKRCKDCPLRFSNF
ncbi:MAG: hypothetical protein MUE81_02165 [Thermoflexibacter sp.]|jgi:hypothetical protein|nr:hypothetical protein [Thermoflexibacter sp.]